MTPQMERNLREMGLLPATLLEELSGTPIPKHSCPTMAKGYFNDPRDPITGEVPY